MSRQIDFDVIKVDIENAHKLEREQILELAEELITHVEYWENSERSSVKTLTKMLSDVREELEKSQKLIMEQAEIFLDTHVSIEARDMEIKRLKMELEASKPLYSRRMLQSVNEKLREALEFYADTQNYEQRTVQDVENWHIQDALIDEDEGKRAREALKNHSLSN